MKLFNNDSKTAFQKSRDKVLAKSRKMLTTLNESNGSLTDLEQAEVLNALIRRFKIMQKRRLSELKREQASIEDSLKILEDGD